MQGAQSESRSRGIGRYSLALSLAVARNAQEHELWLVLNGALGAAVEDIRKAFAGLIARERIRVFDILAPSAEIEPRNSPRARANELLREYFIEQIRPDAVLVTSLFEGLIDDSVVSVGSFVPGTRTAVILYDLIPLLNPAAYLGTDVQRRYYERKIESLRQAGLLLAISEYSREEAIDALGLAPGQVVAISTAVDSCFVPAPPNAERMAALRAQFALRGEFVMYAPGGFDSRKNIDGLISAFSQLPAALRARHQLLIASKLSEDQRISLEQQAQRCGLAANELVLTGYVSDAVLIELYRACALFVFPSKHEGFGLPALEAMSCGAAVIGANTTSIPEVIGCEEALFDPADPAAISAKMAQVLVDPAMREMLRANGRQRAAAFSWDNSAKRALRALEHSRISAAAPKEEPARAKRRVAFVTPVPPVSTSAADRALRMVPALLPYFEVDLIVEQEAVCLPPALSKLACRDAAWLHRHADEYEHILYQLGNDERHAYMLPLMAAHPGVVVLHDFYLGELLSHEEPAGKSPGGWSRALFESHGYRALQPGTCGEGWEQARQLYPGNRTILQEARHVIVHSDHARQMAQQWYGPDAGRDWSVVPLPRLLPGEYDRTAARAALGIRAQAFLVCRAGPVGPLQHCLELLQGWIAAGLAKDADCELVFVGESDGGDYAEQLAKAICAAGTGNRIRISGRISETDYARYLQAADVGVLLGTGARERPPGALVDCQAYGLPTITNAAPSAAVRPENGVYLLPACFTVDELAGALAFVRRDQPARDMLRKAAAASMKASSSSEHCYASYCQALAHASEQRHRGRAALYEQLLDTPGLVLDDAVLYQCARSIARAPASLVPRQLLFDVTAIAQHDLHTGIERVVRTQLRELLQLANHHLRVEPVYFQHEDGAMRCRYARRYAARLLGIDGALPGDDTLVDVHPGDIYYSGDHSPHVTMAAAREGLFANWRMRGVEINFVLYDLLPVLRPEFFPPDADLTHAAWLACITAQADRVIAISAAVAHELRAWLARTAPLQCPPQITALHLAADIAGPPPRAVLESERVRMIAAKPSFLMVGTIEPRKGHLQALDAFDQLWEAGIDVNLVIVGNEGWKELPEAHRRTIPRIVERLRTHPESGRRLLWLTGVDDEELQQLYLASSCLLATSEGEGFGLPLIEAARYGLAVLARDLPVFHEVAGDAADYFSGLDGASLAGAVRTWLTRSTGGDVAKIADMRWITWRENVRRLLLLLQGGAVH
jgi:glycosyltransferase involved in cell wall biosynthesis